MNVGKIFRSSLFKESLIYGVTNAFYSGLPILVLPLLIQVLKPGDYGLVEFYRTLSMVLTPILGLSTVQSITRYFYDLEISEFKRFVSNIIQLHLFNGLIGVLLLFLISALLSDKYFEIVLLCIVYFLFNQITEALLAIYRVKKKPQLYLSIRWISIALDLILMAWLYFVLSEYDWKYRVYPNVASTVIVGVVVLIIFYKKSYFYKIDKSFLTMSLVYSTPLILHMISGYVMNIGDRFFILFFLTEEDLGNYAIAYQLGTLVSFLYTSFNLAWVPTFFEKMKKKEYSSIAKIRNIIFGSILIFSLAVVLLIMILLKYTDFFSNYSISIPVVLLISVAYIFMSMYKFESNYFFFYKKTRELSYITVLSAVITIVLSFVLTPLIGVLGCAIATFVSCLFMFMRVTLSKVKLEV